MKSFNIALAGNANCLDKKFIFTSISIIRGTLEVSIFLPCFLGEGTLNFKKAFFQYQNFLFSLYLFSHSLGTC